MLIVLPLYITERILTIDAKTWVRHRGCKAGMIEDIQGIRAELQALGFTDSNRLADRRIESPLSG